MNKILKVFLKNMFTQKGFYICILISFFLNIALTFISGIISNTDNSITVADQLRSLFGSGLDITQTIFITLFVCADFADGAAKNYIARGYSRRQILTCKFIVTLVGILVFYVIQIIGAFIFFSKNGLGFIPGDFLYILGCIASTIATVGLYVVIANTVEKLGTAIMINILLPSIIVLILPIITNVLNLKIELISYWVGNLAMIMSKIPTIKELLLVVGISLVYLILLFEFSNYIIKRKEVK